MAPQHAQAHMYLGVVHIFTNRAAQGISECEQALALDRNLANAHGFIGLAKFFLGRGEETEAHVHEAFRLSPRDIFAYRWMMFVGRRQAAGTALTPKRSSGYAVALRPTAIFPSGISYSLLAWRYSGTWTRRGPPPKRDLRSTQTFRSSATALALRATTRSILPDASAYIRACAWPGCQRGDARYGSNGQRVSGPQVGAIAVMSRGRRGGHVGIITGVDAKGNPIMISGNNGNRVREAPVSRGRIYAYVMPTS